MLDLNRNGKDDFLEVKDGIVEAVTSASAWLLGEIQGLIPGAQKALNDALTTAKGDGVKPIGEVVADTLTILYNDAHDIFVGAEDATKAAAKEIKSSVIEAAAGLTLQKAPE